MGKPVIEISKLTKNVFMPVIQLREVSRARILPLDEKKKRGITDTDVMIDSVLFGRRFITRKELLENYGELNGRRIKLRGWRTDKPYSVLGRGNNPAYAVRVPTGYDFNFRGKRIPGGSAYLVCRANENGEPALEDVRVVKRGMFRKTFSIPINEHIAKYSNIKMDRPREVVSPRVKQVEKRVENTQTPINPVNTVGKYMIVGRLADIENRDVGFVMTDPKGSVLDMTTANVYRLVQKNMVGNATIVKDQNTGKSWLRGVGVKLSDIPKKMIR